jgi:hypothetical protein
MGVGLKVFKSLVEGGKAIGKTRASVGSIGAGLGFGTLAVGGINMANDESVAMADEQASLRMQRAAQIKLEKIKKLGASRAAMIARMDPKLYNEMLLGRMLAPGDLYIGPTPPDGNLDILQQLTLEGLSTQFK